ncbi:MAG: hypothetical protein FJ091_04675 [Deltaproteobacteria bacterium]|nr:hypothetical protein [Deltaproteobacteria bacterium]
MNAEPKADWTHSLGAWIARDVLLLAAFVALWSLLRSWHAASASWPSAIVLGVASFVFAYAACYVAHEWGHELGARALGASPPRGSARGVVMPLFDPRTHTRAQFFGLAFGGQLGYVAMALLLLALLQPELGLRVAALAGVAFVVQSLYVDSAALIPALRGVAPAEALKNVTPQLILRRTGIAWSLLAAVLVGVHFTRGLP